MRLFNISFIYLNIWGEVLKALNKLINEYTHYLQQGELQTAYKGIIEFVCKLKTDFAKKYPNYNVSSVYQGYMDMTYFSLSTETLKDKDLKIAIVYMHEKGAFEAWLSARNRDIAKKYDSALDLSILNNINLFHDEKNLDAIVEYSLVSTPNFDNQALLTQSIELGVEKFLSAMNLLFEACDKT